MFGSNNVFFVDVQYHCVQPPVLSEVSEDALAISLMTRQIMLHAYIYILPSKILFWSVV